MGKYLTGTDYQLDEYDAAEMWENPNIATSGNNGTITFRAGNGVLVDDPFDSNRGTVLEVKHFYGQYALGKTDSTITGVEAKPSGVTAYSDGVVPDDTDEFYLAMDMAVPVGFQHNWAIHLWDLVGPYFKASVDPTDLGYQLAAFLQIGSSAAFPGTNTYSNRDYDGMLSIYYYTATRAQGYWFFNPLDPTDPDSNGTSRPAAEYRTLSYGSWNRIEMHVKLNTTGFTVGDPSGANGIIQAWHNGQLMVDLNDVQWINQDSIDSGNDHFTRSQFQTWYGGNDVAWAAWEDQSIYFDNLIISTERITG